MFFKEEQQWFVFCFIAEMCTSLGDGYFSDSLSDKRTIWKRLLQNNLNCSITWDKCMPERLNRWSND